MEVTVTLHKTPQAEPADLRDAFRRALTEGDTLSPQLRSSRVSVRLRFRFSLDDTSTRAIVSCPDIRDVALLGFLPALMSEVVCESAPKYAPPTSSQSKSCRADRRPDPTPINKDRRDHARRLGRP